MAGADHRFLDQVGGVFGDRQAGSRRRQQHDAARHAELQVEAGFLLTKVSSTAASSGAIAIEHLAEPAKSCDQPLGQRLRRRRYAPTPSATWRRRLPATSMTPQPVWRSPGSRSEQAHRVRRAGGRQALSRAMTSSETSKLA